MLLLYLFILSVLTSVGNDIILDDITNISLFESMTVLNKVYLYPKSK